MRSTFAITAAASLLASQAVALDIKVDNQQSIKDAAKSLAKDLMSYYKGNTDSSQLGLLPKPPYYWWEAGAMFGTMIGYSAMTGDKQYDGDVAKAIYSQVSDTKDFMMMNQKDNLGNDDQAFWGLTAMSAAEHNLPVPDGAPKDIWVQAASGCFNTLISRWNTTMCGGGIKWQFIKENNGFNYKSSIANAATMQLGARLALLTNNQTYADKAVMVYDWMQNIGLITDKFQILDGAGDDPENCTKIDQHEWSYNSASVLGATAALASYAAKNNKQDAKTWEDRTAGVWKHATENFLKDGVLYEQPCEDVGTCNTDQKSFKAYLARWATFAGQVVPGVKDDVKKHLGSTAGALNRACTGNGGVACGMKWYDNSYSGETGVGQQMSALEVVLGLLDTNPFDGSNSNKDKDSASSSSSSSSSSAAASTSAPASSSSSASAGPSPSANVTSSVAALAQVASTHSTNGPSSTPTEDKDALISSMVAAVSATMAEKSGPAASSLLAAASSSAAAAISSGHYANFLQNGTTNSGSSSSGSNAADECAPVTSVITVTVPPTNTPVAPSTPVVSVKSSSSSSVVQTTPVATSKPVAPTGGYGMSRNATMGGSGPTGSRPAGSTQTIAQSNGAGVVGVGWMVVLPVVFALI